MESVIYYFSGTGNSYQIATEIASKLGKTDVIRICSSNMDVVYQNEYNSIGFVFPVYYFTLPLMVREFIRKMNISNNNPYIYAVATCGGFVGVSLVHLNKILEEKGYLLSSSFKVIMPDNYQVLYSPSSIEKQHELIDKANNYVVDIVTIVKNKKSVNVKEPHFFLKNIENLSSKIFKPKNKDKNFWTDKNCDGCSICQKVCPAEDIIIVDNKPKWLSNCEQCLACMQWCPQKSIQYKKGTIKRERYNHPGVNVKDMIMRD